MPSTGQREGGARGLGGVRVLELGHMVSAAYASKLMADLGAEVIKVEEPSGDRARARGPFPGDRVDLEKGGLFSFLNTNKKGVSLDVSREPGRFQRLVEWADVLIHNYEPREMRRLAIDYERFRSWNPELVMCSITPFGLDGPHAEFRACELTVTHAGGWAWLSPGASKETDQPPLKAYGHQADYQAGIGAAMVSLAAYYRRRRTGLGEHIDLSAQAFVAGFLEQSVPHYTYAGRVASRLGERLLYPWGIYECADGLMFLVVPEDDQWKRLREVMGGPEWASWEIFATPYERAKNSDVLDGYLGDWMKSWKAFDLFHQGQKKRICFAPVFDLKQMSEDAHLQERGFFVRAPQPGGGELTHPGAPYRLENDWWKIRSPAPKLGEHDSSIETLTERSISDAAARAERGEPPALLAGVRVIDFSWAWAGPFCGLQLGYLGAEIIKVEGGKRKDLARRLRIFPPGMDFGPNRSGVFNQWNQGKKSVLLDLSNPKGAEIARELIRNADVVLENYSTGVMDRLGLGFEELKKIKPDIIMASISGYGHTGPYRNYLSYGPASSPLCGLSSLTGYPGGPPREVGISYGDPNGGLNAAVAICAALVARDRTGEGQQIDLSLWEATAALVSEGWMDFVMNGRQPERIGNRDPQMAPHNCYRCRGEQNWIAIACTSDEEWKALARIVGGPSLAADERFRTAAERKRHEDELDGMITRWTSARDRWKITRELQEASIPAFPSMSSEDLVGDEHLNARGFFVDAEHPEVGRRIHTGMAWRLASRPRERPTVAPLLGQHTDVVLSEILGFDRDQLRGLAALGVTR